LWDKMSWPQQEAYLSLLATFRDEMKLHANIKAPQRNTIAHNHAYLASTALKPSSKAAMVRIG
jgi:hypothetical protein